jgi:hypothetical protein
LQYWFLENAKAKQCIQGREADSPTFTKWAINKIFDLDTLKHSPNIAEVKNKAQNKKFLSIEVEFY